LVLATPVASSAQPKSTYSDRGEVHGCFGTTDEVCKARCGDDDACSKRCHLSCMTDEEVRAMLRSLKAGSSNTR
jgi:hypothetical protein